MNKLASASIALALAFGALTGAPTLAQASTSCGSGTPIDGDINGDGVGDLLVRTDQAAKWTAGASGTPGTLTVSAAAFADLNGDSCADVITMTEPDVNGPAKITSYLGSTTGPTDAVVTEGPILPTNTFAEDPALTWDIDSLAVRQQSGQTQLIAGGMVRGSDEHNFLIALMLTTLDSSREATDTDLIQLTDFGVSGHDTSAIRVAAEADVVVVGSSADVVLGKSQSGSVHVFTGDLGDELNHRGAITQNTPGVPDKVEKGDHFGASVALRDGRLAVGIPMEDLSGKTNTGAVQLFRWDGGSMSFTPTRFLSQNTAGVPGSNKKGDHFGASVAIGRGLTTTTSYDVVIGAPGKNVGSKADAGTVTVAHFTKARYRSYSQSTKKVVDKAEKNDAFGDDVSTIAYAGRGEGLAVIASGERSSSCGKAAGSVSGSAGGVLKSTTKWRLMATPCLVGSTNAPIRFGWDRYHWTW